MVFGEVARATLETLNAHVQGVLGLNPDDLPSTVTLSTYRRAVALHLSRAMSCYAVLGISSDADPVLVQAVFRSWARWTHPDSRTGADADFRRVRTAFETLRDPETRLAHDLELALQSSSSCRVPSTLGELQLSLRVAVRGGAATWGSWTVRVPEGTLPGDVLCLRGAGRHRGDLLLDVRVDTGPFHLDGLNLLCTLPLTWLEAYRALPLSLQTPWGIRTIPLEPPVLDGHVIELAGEGVRRGGKSGALVVRLRLVPPSHGDATLSGVLLRLQGAANPRTELESCWRP